MKLKKGDKVVVIAGKDRGQTGTISHVLTKENRVVVDGVNMVKRHRRANRQGQSGQIIDKPMSLHASNVQLADPKTGKPTRIKIMRTDGKRSRVAVKSGETVK